MKILAIDPGCTESACAVIDAPTRRPLGVAKVLNASMLEVIQDSDYDLLAVEMVASYGMAVGREVFETCVWIGRFAQYSEVMWPMVPAHLVYRRDVKLHHCGSARAKDANITQALIDRFAHGQPNRGKGTKSEPGWFYGVKADIWQAYALAVYAADTAEGVTATEPGCTCGGMAACPQCQERDAAVALRKATR